MNERKNEIYRRRLAKFFVLLYVLLFFQVTFHIHPLDIFNGLNQHLQSEVINKHQHSPIGCAIIFHSTDRATEQHFFSTNDKLALISIINVVNSKNLFIVNIFEEHLRGPPSFC